MQYKVTRQYAKEDEKSLAEFINPDDAMIFIDAKSLLDEKQGAIIIYRLFDHNKLTNEINKAKIKIPISRAKYAEGDFDLLEPFANPFKVIRKNGDGIESLVARFNTIADARIFVEAKLSTKSIRITNNEVYKIMNMDTFVERLNGADFDTITSQSQSSEGNQKTQSFRPTPFATSLRLGPPKWVVDEEEDSKKDEK